MLGGIMNKLKYFSTEIGYVKNKKWKKDLEYLIELLPDYFFTIPASSSGKYHPKFAGTKVKSKFVPVTNSVDTGVIVFTPVPYLFLL